VPYIANFMVAYFRQQLIIRTYEADVKNPKYVGLISAVYEGNMIAQMWTQLKPAEEENKFL
jgi:hypothetical protein